MSTLAPSQAGASTVQTQGGSHDPIYGGGPQLIYRAGGGEANDLDVRVIEGRYVVTDPGAQIEAVEPCVVLDAERHHASCPVSPTPGADIQLGDGDDIAFVDLPAAPRRVSQKIRADAGPGSDRLQGGMTGDELSGGDGDDTILGGDGADYLYGGAGADLLDGGSDHQPRHGLVNEGDGVFRGGSPDYLNGGAGADILRGGPGVGDTVTYTERTLPLVVTLGDDRPDGELGERDLIERDVEGVVGGSGADTLVGDSGTNYLSGQHGDDRMAGGGGTHDVLYGGGGSDVLDVLDGGAEARGTPSFGPGTGIYDDVFDCEVGPPGASSRTDLALVDLGDSGSGSPRPGACETVLFSDRQVMIAPDASGVRVQAGCPAPFDCTGIVSLRVPTTRSAGPAGRLNGVFEPPARWRSIARRSFRSRAATRKRVRVRLSRGSRKSLGKRGARAYVTFSLRALRR